jgi:glycine/D-amino acid oxidase-like deaminating enzyme
MPQPDVQTLVIGAGLTGAMIAHRLALAGNKVDVFDAQQAGQGTTRLSSWLIMPDPNSANLEDTTRGVDRLFQLAMTHQIRAHRVSAQIAQSHTQPFGLNVEIVGTQSAILMSPTDLTLALLAHPNITLHNNVEFQQIEHANDELYVFGNGYSVTAQKIVVACGAFTGMLIPEAATAMHICQSACWVSRPIDKKFNLLLPLMIESGRMTLAKTHDQRVRMSTFVPHTDQNLAEYEDDDMMVGGENVYDDPVEDGQRFLKRYLRELMYDTEEWHVGVSVSTPDNTPLVAGVDHLPGVVYAVVPNVYGAAWSPIVAEWVETMLD